MLPEYQLVMDAQILVTYRRDDQPNEDVVEVLHPERHRLSLPVNGLNCLFQDISVSFNQHTKLDSDRWVNRASLMMAWDNMIYFFYFYW